MGGDAGEFFLGLVIYEELYGAELTSSEVKRLLMGYLDQMEHDHLYWCTDDQAVEHIEKEIDEYGINIQNPRNDIQDSIIEIIAEPNNIGDVHFKTLLNQYQKVNVRKGLIDTFIEVFYRMLWDKNSSYSKKLKLEQLVGSHQEAAFLDIRNDKNCNAPVLKAKDKDLGVSVYYNHHEASKARRSQIASYITNQLNHGDACTDNKCQKDARMQYNEQVIEHRFDNHALSFLEVTGSNIAKNLPFYTILYE